MTKKLGLSLLLATVLSCLITAANQADEVSFVVSASIPSSSGVSIVATQVDAATQEWGSAVTALNFNPMSYDADNGIWLPDHFFAIDVGSTGGTGAPDVTVKYTEGSMPSGQTKGLGYKATATLSKVLGGSEPEQELAKKLLKDLTGAGESISKAQLEGGWLRIYVGIFPGGDAVIEGQGGEPFTNADKPGTYSGILTITATVT